MRTVVTILLIAVLALGLGWLCWSNGGGTAAPVEFVFPPDSAAPLVAPAPATGTNTGPYAVSVLVRVQPRARILAPPHSPQVVVRRGTTELAVPAAIVAGIGAADGTVPDGGGRALVRVEPGAGLAHWRAVTIDGPGAAAVVEFGGDAELRGRVVDDAGAPVPDARVWYGVTLADGKLEVLATDDAGRFTSVLPGGVGIPVVVSAAGHATVGRFVSVAAGGGVDELFVLAAESVLTIQCAAEGRLFTAARVLVAPTSGAHTGAQQYPFFLAAVVGWQQFDAQGRCTLRGLPRGAEVAVLVQHPLAPLLPGKVVQLRREQEQLLLPLQFVPQLNGRVVFAGGAPVAGAQVGVRASGRELAPLQDARALLPPDAGAFGCLLAHTGSDGTFVVGKPPAAAILTVTAPGHAGLELQVDRDHGVLARDLVLPAYQNGPPVLRVPAPAGGPWRVRIAPYFQEFVGCATGQDYLLPLQCAALLDLTVQVERAGVTAAPRQLHDLAVTGTVVLPAGLLQ